MTKEELIDTSEYGYDENKGIWSKYYKMFLEGHVEKNGYKRVILKCIDGKQRLFLYHRAIWYLAYGPIPEGMQVNHIDENKQNNALSNLNLMTPKENTNYGTGIERMAAKKRGVPKPYMIERNKKLCSKNVVAIDEDGNVAYEFASTREAECNGFNHGAVSACCRNCYLREGNNIYKNFRWYYKDEWERMKATLKKRELPYLLEINFD